MRRVLIANRGEIALRIARACREDGLIPLGLYSERDAASPALLPMAETLCIGPAAAARSYLDAPRILRAAHLLKADAIHPGYGFLSENADFAEAILEAGLIWVGPPPPVMRLLGDKIAARRAMRAAGVPCLPGSEAALPEDLTAVRAVCDAIGYPLIIKASGGGGGKGMRIVPTAGELEYAVAAARAEVARSFRDPALYAEAYLPSARHIEIQILAEGTGHAVAVGTRECSVQRRHQKLIEESAPPDISAERLAALGESCARAVASLGYVGAGTVEFLYADNAFFFIEMNTRLQVEHPVTEAVSGIDIVRAQLRIAAGGAPGEAPGQPGGHAIECRINAEHPVTFQPAPGTITGWHLPGGPGVRVDTHLGAGHTVPPDYDSLIAKLIVHAPDRPQALRKLRAALNEMQIEGVETTLPLHRRLLTEPAFLAGGVDTGWLTHLLTQEPQP